MSVVVNPGDPAGLAIPLEPPLGALEALERLHHLRKTDAHLLGHRGRGERVLKVVSARHEHPQLAQSFHAGRVAAMDYAASAEAAHLDVGADDVGLGVVEAVRDEAPLHVRQYDLSRLMVGSL